MNILILSPFFPYPLTQGGKIVIFNIVKYLSKGNKVTLACLSESAVADYGPLQEYCEEIVVIERRPQQVRDLAAFLTGDEPFNSVRYRSDAFTKALRELIQRKSFDVVQIEFTLMWQYAPIFKGIPVTLDAHNIEYEIIRQNRDACGNPAKRLLYALEERKLRAHEERAWRECDLCFTVSDNEREVIASRSGNKGKVTTMIGIDLERFPFQVKPESEKRILFVGGMDYLPNLDSLLYFTGEIFPLIRAKVPGARLDIVGRDVVRVAGQLAGDGIKVHENVPAILPWFRQADLIVVPLRLGAGIRIKILEAMAAGLPIVATPKGCEGIAVEHGEHLLIGDSPESFADAVRRVLGDDGLRRSLARNARGLVERRYSWETLAKDLENMYRKLAGV